MVAIGLIFGELTADHYGDDIAADPRIDRLRSRMEVLEEPRYSRDYLDPAKRSIANSVHIIFRDGSSTERMEVEYPLGHRRRRKEGLPLLLGKCRANLCSRLSTQIADGIMELCLDRQRLVITPVDEFMGMLVE